MKDYVLGFDIGGTKCAAILGKTAFSDKPDKFILDSITFPTQQKRGWKKIVDELLCTADKLLKKCGVSADEIEAAGISCGGPLDSKTGTIKCPPNLPDWDNVPLTDIITDHFGFPAYLQNDANACALAEWKFGAGKGFDNLVFLTFGTGMGAGLILDGKLYSGTNDMAGEVGHIRLCEDGPEGYGKNGSFEGFCSGGGIARLAKSIAREKLANGIKPMFCKDESELESVTAKSVAIAAESSDETAKEIYNICGKYLGRGLSVIIDIINPQAIVIGSIYERSGHLLCDAMEKEIKSEALSLSAQVCKILPAKLGDSIGNFAALGVAMQ